VHTVAAHAIEYCSLLGVCRLHAEWARPSVVHSANSGFANAAHFSSNRVSLRGSCIVIAPTFAAVLIEVLGGKGLESGQFFVYQREGKSADEEVVLCVVYKGKGTHHLMQLVDGNWVVNKKSFGSNSTLEKVD
jgi:hypothetical protein